MFEIISAQSKLQYYQKRFIYELDRIKTSTVRCTISWRPVSKEADVTWSSRLNNLWWYSEPMGNRWWNAFGIGQPVSDGLVKITCEINIPMRGINRNIAGAFVEDQNKKVFIAHRGNRWGGGRKGITKKLFWQNYKGRSEVVNDGGRSTKVAIIAEIGSPKLPSEIADFVNWVAGTKNQLP